MVTGREPSRGAGRAALLGRSGSGIHERSALDYLLARTQLQAVSRAVSSALWDDYDVVLTPALAERPVRDRRDRRLQRRPRWDDFRALRAVHARTPPIFNVTGQPAISLPLFHGDDGLPLAVQLAGRPADEASCSRWRAQLEAARPWADRRPELATA